MGPPFQSKTMGSYFSVWTKGAAQLVEKLDSRLKGPGIESLTETRFLQLFAHLRSDVTCCHEGRNNIQFSSEFLHSNKPNEIGFLFI